MLHLGDEQKSVDSFNEISEWLFGTLLYSLKGFCSGFSL